MAPYFWLQPAVTGAAAILVLLGAGLTIRQRYRADRKDQWWKRTQWAFDLLLTGEEDREVLGLLVLAQQAAAKAADTRTVRSSPKLSSQWWTPTCKPTTLK